MLNFTASTQSSTQIKSDALIVRIFEGEKILEPKIKELDKKLNGEISELLKSGDFEGKLKDVVTIYSHKRIEAKRIILIGLGKKKDFSMERSRETISHIIPLIKKFKAKSAAILLTKIQPKNAGVQTAIQAIVEALFLSSYTFLEYKNLKENRMSLEAIHFVLNTATDRTKALRGAKTGYIIASAVNFSRDLANKPGNHMTPQALADAAMQMAKENKIKCKVLEKPEIKKLGMGAFLGVNKGSPLDPKFIVLEYFGKKTGQPTVLVGKGITFDTGGISIKPSRKMEEMKFDMCGAANVLGIMKAVSELKLPYKLIGLIPATENMPSGEAIKPGDIVKAMNGKTIQVTNTDAEGRLILADALSYAARYKPKAVIDYATLTGAVIAALGTDYTAALTNDEKLFSKLEKASKESGEKIWRLPLAESYREKIKSPIADIDNIGTQEGAGTITAGLILQEFVSYPWIHLDIAGTAWTTTPKPGKPIGATGEGIRLTLEFLK